MINFLKEENSMLFADSHEWIKLEGDIATLGISSFARKELGDVVFIQFPKIGDQLKAYTECIVIESTKAATDIYTPVSGTVLELNEKLVSNLNLLNRDPENSGWMIKIKLDHEPDLKYLMSFKDYQELIEG